MATSIVSKLPVIIDTVRKALMFLGLTKAAESIAEGFMTMPGLNNGQPVAITDSDRYAIVDLKQDRIIEFISAKRVYIMLTRPASRCKKTTTKIIHQFDPHHTPTHIAGCT